METLPCCISFSLSSDEAYVEGDTDDQNEEKSDEIGEVVGFSDKWEGKEACNIAEVRYSKSKSKQTERIELCRVGHNGVVDIMCTENGQEAWGMFYKKHLPVFGKKSSFISTTQDICH